VDGILIAVRNKTHVQKLKAKLKKEFDMKNLRYGDHSRQRLMQNLAIPGELCSQDVGEVQYSKSKTSHHLFGRSLQIILQPVSTTTGKGGGDVSSTIC